MEQLKQPTITELKAYAYDISNGIANLQSKLNRVTSQIANMQQVLNQKAASMPDQSKPQPSQENTAE